MSDCPNTFTDLFAWIRSDIEHHSKSRRLLARISALMFNVSLKVIICYRLQKYLSTRRRFRFTIVQVLLAYWQVTRGSCQISPKATIGKRFRLQHPIGVVIGIGSRIGDDVCLWQNVTIGNDGKSDAYPILQNGVRVFAASAIVGNVILGEGCTVGAMSLVNSDVPANAIAYGIPAKVKTESGLALKGTDEHE